MNKTPKPMAGASETIAHFNLSDEQWDIMPRQIGCRLRESLFLIHYLGDALRDVRGNIDVSTIKMSRKSQDKWSQLATQADNALALLNKSKA